MGVGFYPFHGELFLGGAIAWDETLKRKILSPHFLRRSDFSSDDVIRRILRQLEKKKYDADFAERMIYTELKLRLPELLLMRVDKITMSVSVEGIASAGLNLR